MHKVVMLEFYRGEPMVKKIEEYVKSVGGTFGKHSRPLEDQLKKARWYDAFKDPITSAKQADINYELIADADKEAYNTDADFDKNPPVLTRLVISLYNDTQSDIRAISKIIVEHFKQMQADDNSGIEFNVDDRINQLDAKVTKYRTGV